MNKKKRKILFLTTFLIGLILILVIAVFGNYNFTNLIDKNSNESGVLAYVDGHTVLNSGGTSGGDVWIINPYTKEKTKITENASIQWVHEWSPDNKNLAVVTNKKEDSIKYELAVVGIGTGRMRMLGHEDSRRTFWNANNEIIFLNPDKPNNSSLNVIDIDDLSRKVLLNIPDELFSEPQFSEDRHWVATADSPFATGKLYSFNVENGALNTLSEERADFGGWLNGKIIYATHKDSDNGIWEIDPDGSNKRELVDIGNSYISHFSISGNGKVLAYISTEVLDGRSESKLFTFDYDNNKVVGPLLENVTASQKIGVLELSKDGRFLIFFQAGYGVRMLDFNNDELYDICKSVYCNASWSN